MSCAWTMVSASRVIGLVNGGVRSLGMAVRKSFSSSAGGTLPRRFASLADALL